MARRLLGSIRLATLTCLIVLSGTASTAGGAYEVIPGSFSERSFRPGGASAGIAAGYLDGDSHLDLVGADEDDITPTFPLVLGEAVVWMGDGGGGFTESAASPHFVSDRGATSVVTGDFDGQEAEDLAIGDGDGNVHILLSEDGGSFAAAPTSPILVGETVRGLVAADFDGDLHLDLAAVIAGKLRILLGTGSGDFEPLPATSVHETPFEAAAGYVNGDGIVDLVVSHRRGITLLRGDGTGEFLPAVGKALPPASSLVLGYFNTDPYADLAISAKNRVHVLLGDSVCCFTTPASPSVKVGGRRHNAGSLAAGDFDADGDDDLAVAMSTEDVVILLSDGGGSFREPSTSPVRHVVMDATDALVGDFDEGGDADLAFLSSESPITILLNLASQRSDLSLSVTDAPDPVGTSGTLAYTISIENQGPDHATGIRLRGRLGAKRVAPRADCSQKRNRTGPRIRCPLGWLDPGEATEVELIVDAGEDPGMIASRFRVSAQQLDPDDSDDRVVVETRVRRNVR